MRLADIDYDLDPALIAQVPVEPRDAARLLVDRGRADPEHRHVRDLPELLVDGDVVVVNDSRVLPARLRLRRETGGAAEVLLLEALDDRWNEWEALIRPARRLRPGETLSADDGAAVVEIGARRPSGDTFAVTIVAASGGDGGQPSSFDDVAAALARYGELPLPPYITTTLADPERYQTVYAAAPGSAAAPTAGLHLTPTVLAELDRRGIPLVRVELAVGLDTFAPVTVDDPTAHPMHTERYRIAPDAWATVNDARRVVAVGTTSVRALESARRRHELAGRTDILLHAGNPVEVVDLVLTNFHLPRTTLLMLIEAVIGTRWRRLYDVAIAERYRFLSFGDAMLLDRHA